MYGHMYILYTVCVDFPIRRATARGDIAGEGSTIERKGEVLTLSLQRKVVGGNKALGTTLLRPLIWRARRYICMCAIHEIPGNTEYIYPLNSRSRERRCIHNGVFSSLRNYE